MSIVIRYIYNMLLSHVKQTIKPAMRDVKNTPSTFPIIKKKSVLKSGIIKHVTGL